MSFSFATGFYTTLTLLFFVIARKSCQGSRLAGTAHRAVSPCDVSLALPHLRRRGQNLQRGSPRSRRCKGCTSPRLEPSNANRSQTHQLLVLRLRFKPGRFPVRLVFPHCFIQRVWKLETGRFIFAESAAIYVL